MTVMRTRFATSARAVPRRDRIRAASAAAAAAAVCAASMAVGAAPPLLVTALAVLGAAVVELVIAAVARLRFPRGTDPDDVAIHSKRGRPHIAESAETPEPLCEPVSTSSLTQISEARPSIRLEQYRPVPPVDTQQCPACGGWERVAPPDAASDARCSTCGTAWHPTPPARRPDLVVRPDAGRCRQSTHATDLEIS